MRAFRRACNRLIAVFLGPRVRLRLVAVFLSGRAARGLVTMLVWRRLGLAAAEGDRHARQAEEYQLASVVHANS
jgi:hypothetical protein